MSQNTNNVIGRAQMKLLSGIQMQASFASDSSSEVRLPVGFYRPVKVLGLIGSGARGKPGRKGRNPMGP